MTVAQADLKTKLEALFSETLGDTMLTDCVDAAVTFYSRYSPTITEATMSLVEDQVLYNLPDTFLFFAWFDWWPDGEATVSGTTHDELWDTAYEAALLDAKARRLSPFVEVAGKKLILHTAPSDDEDVPYAYYGLHVLESGNYATIPPEDETLLLQLAAAEVLERKAGQVALDPDITEGLLQLRVRSVTGNIISAVQSLRSGVKRKYGGY
jgi:hypothetical protein